MKITKEISIGDVAASVERDTLVETDPAVALHNIYKLKIHDFAFVLRSKLSQALNAKAGPVATPLHTLVEDATGDGGIGGR